MKTFAKVTRKGQKFYIQPTPSRGVYDSTESVIGDDEIIIKMLDNRKGYESGYLFITKNPSSKDDMCVSDFLLQNNLAAGLIRTGIFKRLGELEKGSEIYVMYYNYNARLRTDRPIKLNLVWAAGVVDKDLDNNSRMVLSRVIARLIPINKE